MQIKNAKYLTYHLKEKLLSKKYNLSNKRIFLHIPKTAGNSFITCIYNSFLQKEIYPNYFEKTILNKGNYLANNNLFENYEKRLIEKTWLLGHFDINFARSIWPNAKIYTFLRDPVERIISNIYHLKTKNENFKEIDIHDILTQFGPQMAFQQSRLLGFDIKKRNWNTVKKNIENLHFLGITEQYQRSLNLLNAMESWKGIESIQSNVGNYSKEEADHSILTRIRSMNIFDNQLYQFAKESFESRCSQYKV